MRSLFSVSTGGFKFPHHTYVSCMLNHNCLPNLWCYKMPHSHTSKSQIGSEHTDTFPPLADKCESLPLMHMLEMWEFLKWQEWERLEERGKWRLSERWLILSVQSAWGEFFRSQVSRGFGGFSEWWRDTFFWTETVCYLWASSSSVTAEVLGGHF